MLSYEYLEDVINSKDYDLAQNEADKSNKTVSWSICDGALVIYDQDDPPSWFKFDRDENGDKLVSVLTKCSA